MLKVFMLIAILLTTGFGVQYAYFANFKATTISQNELTASSILNRLKSYAVKNGETYLMPLGVNGDEYHELPTYIAGSRVTRSGIPFMYCPFSDAPLGSEDSDIKLSESEDYKVSVVNSAVTNERDYVIGSPASPVADVVALLISLEKRSQIPDCRDVEVNAEGRYVLGGNSVRTGRVYALTIHDIQVSEQVNVQYVGSAGNALNVALNDASNRPTEEHIIVLKGGESYSLSNDFVFESAYLGKKGSIIVRGESPTSLSNITTTGGSSVNMSFNGMSVVFENISLSNSISLNFDNADVRMRRLSGGVTSITSSEVHFDNVGFNGNTLNKTALSIISSSVFVQTGLNITGHTNPATYIEDSKLTTNALTFNLGIGSSGIGVQLLNSEWSSRTTNLVYSVRSGATAQTVVYIDGLSRFAWSGGGVLGSGNLDYGVFVEGETVIQNADFMFDSNTSVALGLSAGARANLSSMTLGDSSSYVGVGLLDNGGSSVRGDVSIYASTCFAGDGFTNSLTGVVRDDTVTQVNPDFSIVVGSVSRDVNLDVTDKFNTMSTTCL
tara:strand:+ start:2791 stop:4452 length:1662 start_codon:yes stop_codon:yes gene_type:complete